MTSLPANLTSVNFQVFTAASDILAEYFVASTGVNFDLIKDDNKFGKTVLTVNTEAGQNLILLSTVEANCPLTNIMLSDPYPPTQQAMTVKNFAADIFSSIPCHQQVDLDFPFPEIFNYLGACPSVALSDSPAHSITSASPALPFTYTF